MIKEIQFLNQKGLFAAFILSAFVACSSEKTAVISPEATPGAAVLPQESIPSTAPVPGPALEEKKIILENSALPVTTLSLVLRVGSADDPKSQEGIAELTSRMIRDGGVAAYLNLPARTRDELENALFPLAAEIDVQMYREQTTFSVTAPADQALVVFQMLKQILVAPAFSETEFARIKNETLEYLTKAAPADSQEELGKEALSQMLYGAAHPYAHPVEGLATSVQNLSLDQVKDFYKNFYTQSRLTVGVAGSLSEELKTALAQGFTELPKGTAASSLRPQPPAAADVRLKIVTGAFTATGVHMGQTLSVNRTSEDFPALYLAATAFGKHRSFVGRLMKVVRAARGINYGTYAYVEDFPWGGRLLTEPTQVARVQQAFTMWGRPSTLANGCFLAKQMYREAVQLSKVGLTPEEFDVTHQHMIGQIPLLGKSLGRQLGYSLDASFYGAPSEYLASLQEKVAALEFEAVNETLRRTLNPAQFSIVVVTPDAAQFQKELQSGNCPITYQEGITKPEEILKEDKEISTYTIPVAGTEVVPAAKIYQ